MSAASEGKPAAKPSHMEDFGSGLSYSGGTRFEAKRTRMKDKRGYFLVKMKLYFRNAAGLSRLWAKGPVNSWAVLAVVRNPYLDALMIYVDDLSGREEIRCHLQVELSICFCKLKLLWLFRRNAL